MIAPVDGVFIFSPIHFETSQPWTYFIVRRIKYRFLLFPLRSLILNKYEYTDVISLNIFI